MIRSRLVLIALVFLSGSVARGAPLCVSDTLGGYISLGAAGCQVGGATFSGFAMLAPITGATPISNVTISPYQASNVVGFDFQINGAAVSGDLLQAIFGFQVTGNSIVADSLSVSGVSSTGAGFITDIQDYCLGGSFPPNDVTGCGGTAGTLVVVDNGGDQASFGGVSLVGVVNDFTLDAGSGGGATGGLVSQRFTLAASAVPEPQTWMLLSSALMGLGVVRVVRNGKRGTHA